MKCSQVLSFEGHSLPNIPQTIVDRKKLAEFGPSMASHCIIQGSAPRFHARRPSLFLKIRRNMRATKIWSQSVYVILFQRGSGENANLSSATFGPRRFPVRSGHLRRRCGGPQVRQYRPLHQLRRTQGLSPDPPFWIRF